MSAIIGFGAIGQALARAFTRKNLQVTVTSRRAPEVIAPEAKAIGPTVTASLCRTRSRPRSSSWPFLSGCKMSSKRSPGAADRSIPPEPTFRRSKPTSIGSLAVGHGVREAPRKRGQVAIGRVHLLYHHLQSVVKEHTIRQIRETVVKCKVFSSIIVFQR